MDSPSTTPGRLVRPYSITRGRTHAGEFPIALEALVAVTPDGMRNRRRYRWEEAEIITLTRRETAVIELAAALEVPIGVVRVLVSDLREHGAVSITEPVEDVKGTEYTDLLSKVLDGIKSL